MRPSISVITICFNNLADLQRTCTSVDAQTEHPEEHWIVNGSGTPDIADWLSAAPQPHYRKWISEHDKGISDAFNKGIALSSGDLIQLLNSGDVYAVPDVLAAVSQAFTAHPGAQWLSGKLQIKRAGHWVETGKPFRKSKLYRGMRSVSHPTWFVRREAYERAGQYRLEEKIAMDYDMMCRIAGEPYIFLDKPLVRFDDTGISTTQYLESLTQSTRVYESHFGYSLRARAWQFRLRLLHRMLQTKAGKWLFAVKRKMGLENA